MDKGLLKEIEGLRRELNCELENSIFINDKIILMSQELDVLIHLYIKEMFKYHKITEPQNLLSNNILIRK